MVIKIVNSAFVDVGMGVSLPSGWLGNLELDNVIISGGDKGVEIRDPESAKSLNVPDEIIKQVILALEETKIKKLGEDEAKALVAAKPPVKSFLLENGYSLANLGIGAGQLIAAIIALTV